MGRQRNDHGQYVEEVSLERVLAEIKETNEPVTATEIGDALGISNRAVLNKLNVLHERGNVGRKEVGASAVVWWIDGQTAPEATDGTEVTT